jgi:hypothetical protein
MGMKGYQPTAKHILRLENTAGSGTLCACPGSNLNLIQLAYTLSCVAFDHLPGFTPLRSRLFRFLRVSLAVQVRGHGACGTPAAGDTLP